MNLDKPMKILILEDEEFERNRYINYMNSRIDAELVYTTNSANDALEFIKTHHIEGIIVDIELHDGNGGTGLDFLSNLNLINIDIRPIVIITTNNISKRVHNMARKLRSRFNIL